MPTETKETVTTDMTASKAKRMSERIRDQVVKVEGEQGTLRNLLVDFNEGNGWKALGYRNWEGWANKVLPQSRSMLFRQLAAGQHEAALGINVGDTPESHLRNLSKVPAEKRQDVMDRADVLAVEADRPRQAGDVRAAIREVIPTTARVVDDQATTEARPISAAPRDSVGVDIPEALLGVFDGNDNYEQLKVQLSPGDRLLLYTDGFEHAFPDKDAGGERLPGTTLHYRDEFGRLGETEDPQGLIEEVCCRLDVQHGSLHQADDLTLLCLQVGPASQAEPAVDTLAA